MVVLPISLTINQFFIIIRIMKTNSFVYKWTHLENGKCYIGKHTGTEDDGYISSGKAFLSVYKKDPSKFVRTILYKGMENDTLRTEQEMIQSQIKMYGYESVYNLTTWEHLKEWKRTCTHCGCIVDPRNIEWLSAFEDEHFENCSKNPINVKPAPKKIKLKKIITKKISTIDRKIQRQKEFNIRMNRKLYWWKLELNGKRKRKVKVRTIKAKRDRRFLIISIMFLEKQLQDPNPKIFKLLKKPKTERKILRIGA